MMLTLIVYILHNIFHVGLADGKRAIPVLPLEIMALPHEEWALKLKIANFPLPAL